MSLQIKVDEPIVAGQTGLGKRQLILIRGGTVSGAVKGRVLPGGADAQIIRPNGRVDLSARYALETEEHEVIYVENNGTAKSVNRSASRLQRGASLITSTCISALCLCLKQAVRHISICRTGCLSGLRSDCRMTFGWIFMKFNNNNMESELAWKTLSEAI